MTNEERTETLRLLGKAIRDGRLTADELLTKQVEAVRDIPADAVKMREALDKVERDEVSRLYGFRVFYAVECPECGNRFETEKAPAPEMVSVPCPECGWNCGPEQYKARYEATPWIPQEGGQR